VVDGSRVNIADAVASTGFPFSGMDVVFSGAVGVVLLVVAVGARLVIGWRRRPAQPRVVRAPRHAHAETDIAASG